MNVDLPALPPHRLRVVLLEPQIAPNTGNIARLCVASGTELHLVRPMGFVLSDRNLRRSAMDYWPRLKLTVHDDAKSFFHLVDGSRMWMFTSKAKRSLWEADFRDADWLVFGNETRGIGDEWTQRFGDCTVRIPQAGGERCLNLSTAVGIGLFEAIRQTGIGQPGTA